MSGEYEYFLECVERGIQLNLNFFNGHSQLMYAAIDIWSPGVNRVHHAHHRWTYLAVPNRVCYNVYNITTGQEHELLGYTFGNWRVWHDMIAVMLDNEERWISYG